MSLKHDTPNPDLALAHSNQAVSYRKAHNYKMYVAEMRLAYASNPTWLLAYRLFEAYEQQYRWLVSILLVSTLALTIVTKVRLFLILPAFLVVHGMFSSYLFVREGRLSAKGGWKAFLFSLFTDTVLAIVTVALFEAVK